MSIEGFIHSGIIEQYVLGLASAEEIAEVEEMSAKYPEVFQAIDDFSMQLEAHAKANAIAPDPTIRPFLLATIDYMERMKNGEQPSNPPLLHEHSRISDYQEWLNRQDMVLPPNFRDVYAKIIGHTPEMLTAIVWLKRMAPAEVHDDEFERFLVVEGTCIITIANKDYNLKAGDYLTIPLHQSHHVKVTSPVPCKIILQRIAA